MQDKVKQKNPAVEKALFNENGSVKTDHSQETAPAVKKENKRKKPALLILVALLATALVAVSAFFTASELKMVKLERACPVLVLRVQAQPRYMAPK